MAKVLERSLYQTDYYAWTKDQAAKLRAMASRRESSPRRSNHWDAATGARRAAKRSG